MEQVFTVIGRIGVAIGQGLRDSAAMLLDPSERIYWGYLVGALVIASMVHGVDRRHARTRTAGRALQRSSLVDLELLVVNTTIRTCGALVFTLSAFGTAVWLVGRLDTWLGTPRLVGVPVGFVALAYTLVLFVMWDWSRWLLHRWMHQVPWLWELHKVHHSAEVLTPLTLYRTHPVESLLFGLRGVIVTAPITALFFWLFRRDAVELELLGVNVLGFVFNLVGANLRHSHVWWGWGALENWLMSPAQHQLHHALDARRTVNLGTWLSFWDRRAGTLEIAGAEPPPAFGLAPEEANHDPRRLGSALWRPAAAALSRLGAGGRGVMRASIVVLGAIAPGMTSASSGPDPSPSDEPDQPTPPTSDAAASDAEDEGEGDENTRTVVVGSMFDGDELPRVAGSAHVVGERELERHEYDDIHRVLTLVPGVYVRGEDGFGLRPNIGLRGANPDRSAKVTLMEDGILLAPAPYSAPAAYYFPLPTRMVGMEVFKGPASIRYGPNTIGGAINLRTRTIPMMMSSVIDVAGGRFGYAKGHGFWGTTHKGFGVLLEAAHVQSDGFKQLDNGGDTGFHKNDAMVKLGYEARVGPRATHRVELKGGFANEVSRETYLGLTRADFEDTPYRRYVASARDRMSWWRSQVELGYVVGDDVIELETRLYRHDFHRVWRRLDHFRDGPDLAAVLANPDSGQLAVLAAVLRGEEDSASPDQALMVTNNDRRFVSQGAQTVLRWRPRREKLSQDLEIGVRVHNDSIVRNHVEDAYMMTAGTMVAEGSPPTVALRNRGETTAAALHVFDAVTLWDRLTVAPGLRVEVISMRYRDRLAGDGAERTDVGVTPGIGVLVAALPWLGVFAGVHRGFSPVAPGQPRSVKPERAVNYELGVRAHRRGLWAEAVGFFSDYGNLNGLCTFSSGCTDGDGSQQFNAGKVWVYGVESLFRWRHRFRSGFGLEVGTRYTYTGSQFRRTFQSPFNQWGDVEAGDELPYLPAHVVGGTLGVGGRIWDIVATPAYASAMRDVAGQGPIPAAERIDGFFLLDLAAEVRLFGRLRLYAQMSNATANAYVAARRPYGILPGAPLTFMIGVKGHVFP